MKDNILTFKPLLFIVGLFLALVMINFFDISYPITVTNTTRSAELSVVGEGKVDVVPDTAYVDLGVSIENAPTVEAAQSDMTKRNNAIIKAMEELGLKKENIKTSNFSIYPSYDYRESTNRVTGYTGNVTLSIKMEDTSLTSKVISLATQAGANQIQGTRFTVDKPETYREKARDAAIANAKAQAEKLSQSLGIRLGKIVNIVESTPNDFPIYYSKLDAVAAPEAAGGDRATIEPGTQTISSVVTLYFEKR